MTATADPTRPESSGVPAIEFDCPQCDGVISCVSAAWPGETAICPSCRRVTTFRFRATRNQPLPVLGLLASLFTGVAVGATIAVATLGPRDGAHVADRNVAAPTGSIEAPRPIAPVSDAVATMAAPEEAPAATSEVAKTEPKPPELPERVDLKYGWKPSMAYRYAVAVEYESDGIPRNRNGILTHQTFSPLGAPVREGEATELSMTTYVSWTNGRRGMNYGTRSDDSLEATLFSDRPGFNSVSVDRYGELTYPSESFAGLSTVGFSPYEVLCIVPLSNMGRKAWVSRTRGPFRMDSRFGGEVDKFATLLQKLSQERPGEFLQGLPNSYSFVVSSDCKLESANETEAHILREYKYEAVGGSVKQMLGTGVSKAVFDRKTGHIASNHVTIELKPDGDKGNPVKVVVEVRFEGADEVKPAASKAAAPAPAETPPPTATETVKPDDETKSSDKAKPDAKRPTDAAEKLAARLKPFRDAVAKLESDDAATKVEALAFLADSFARREARSEVLAAVERAMGDQRPEVLAKAVAAMATWYDGAQSKDIVALIDHEDRNVRQAVYDYLTCPSDSRQFELLIDRLGSPTDGEAIRKALVAAGVRAEGRLVGYGLKSGSVEIRKACCEILGESGAALSTVTALKRIVAEAGPVATAAQTALDKMGAAKDRPPPDPASNPFLTESERQALK